MLILCSPQTLPSSLSLVSLVHTQPPFLKAIGLRGKYVNTTRSDTHPDWLRALLYANESALYWMGLKFRVRGG